MLMIAVPQFEMHPLVFGAAVPGAPVAEFVAVQNSSVVPHWPQISQQALRGQGFSPERVDMSAGFAVLFT